MKVLPGSLGLRANDLAMSSQKCRTAQTGLVFVSIVGYFNQRVLDFRCSHRFGITVTLEFVDGLSQLGKERL
jgi:hypothetical protein